MLATAAWKVALFSSRRIGLTTFLQSLLSFHHASIELCALSGFLDFVNLQSHDPSTNLATLRMIAGRKLGALPRFIELWDGIVVLNERRLLDLQVQSGITHTISVRVLPYICTGLLSSMFHAWSDECRIPALADYSSSESNFQENSDSSSVSSDSSMSDDDDDFLCRACGAQRSGG